MRFHYVNVVSGPKYRVSFTPKKCAGETPEGVKLRRRHNCNMAPRFRPCDTHYQIAAAQLNSAQIIAWPANHLEPRGVLTLNRNARA